MKKKGDFFRKALFKILPFETYLSILSKGYFFSFDTGLLKGKRVYEYPYFLKNIIKQDDVCLDIGANLGYYSVLFSKLVGKKGQVYSVEPVKPMLSVLTNNTKRCKNVKIYPYALGTENKAIFLGNDTKSDHGYLASGSNFVLDKKVNKQDTAETQFEANMRRGSELFNHLPRLDFIKCDIEGYEVVVLKEMGPLIRKFHPMLLIETRGQNRTDLLQFFHKLNYHTFVLDGEKLHPTDGKGSWDVLVVPEKRLERVSQYIVESSSTVS